MLKNIINLEGAQKLSKNEQKNIVGGLPVQPANCKCFCMVGINKVDAYCYALCPGGSLPGISDGSTGNCNYPFPFPPTKPGIE
jgi:hypothetical protein